MFSSLEDAIPRPIRLRNALKQCHPVQHHGDGHFANSVCRLLKKRMDQDPAWTWDGIRQAIPGKGTSFELCKDHNVDTNGETPDTWIQKMYFAR